jgi:hypothetical protein
MAGNSKELCLKLQSILIKYKFTFQTDLSSFIVDSHFKSSDNFQALIVVACIETSTFKVIKLSVGQNQKYPLTLSKSWSHVFQNWSLAFPMKKQIDEETIDPQQKYIFLLSSASVYDRIKYESKESIN